jgi:hypothetical protein
MHLLDKVKLILLSPCHLVVKNVYVYAFHHIILALHSLYILYIYLCAHTYRIARGSNSIRICGRGRGPAGDLVVGGSRRRRTGAGRTS